MEMMVRTPFKVAQDFLFSGDQREELKEVLNIQPSPYSHYAEFLDAARKVARDRTPRFFSDICARLRAQDIEDKPVFMLGNCPVDDVIPILGFEDPLAEKYRLKKTFVAEAFLAVFTELMGTCIMGYRTANNGDMFHDIHPMRKLAHTPSQKTVDTIRYHADIPNNLVRPDWVYLLSLRNSPVNKVYTQFVRLADVFDCLESDVFATLCEPIFHSPRETIHVYGGQAEGFTPRKPVVVSDRGYTFLAYFEGNTTSDSKEGRAALECLNQILHSLGDPVFLTERSLVAVSNNTAMHARHVAEINDLAAHRNRWLLKTWNVDEVAPHAAHLMPGRIHTSDE